MATIATSTTFGGTKLYNFKAMKDTTAKVRDTDYKLWIKADAFALGGHKTDDMRLEDDQSHST